MPAKLRTLLGALAAATVLLGVGGAPTVGTADPFRPALEDARRDHGNLVPDRCRAQGKQVKPLVCTYGNPNGKKVVLFGDSHALQWGPAIVPLAKQRGWKLITLLRAGCPIANIKTDPECAEWRVRAMNRIEEVQPRHIIISTSIAGRYRIKHGGLDLSRKESEPRLRDGMTRTINRLKQVRNVGRDGRGVILIRDQVMAPFVPADCLKEHNGDRTKCVFPNQRRWAPGFDWIAAKRAGILPTIDPTKALCGPEWCTSTRGRIVKYRDTDHITATYAKTLTDWFGERLGIE